MKKTIVFLDHSFHKKTKSSNFFKNILQKEYKVEWLWGDSWTGKLPVFFKRINFLNKENDIKKYNIILSNEWLSEFSVKYMLE